jgi:hypothetical protein
MFPQRELDGLANVRMIYIATVRQDDSQSSATPVWFTLSSDRAILIQTGPNSWHARRIRRGSQVIFWVGKLRGPAFIGSAEITNDAAVIAKIVEDYPEKYLMARLGIHRPKKEQFEQGKRLAIKITPTHPLPADFRSRPGTPAPILKGARGE